LLALNDPQAEVMLAIWKLRSDHSAVHVTKADVANATRQPQRSVAQILRRIQERRPGRPYFIIMGVPARDGRPGRPRNSYYLNGEVVVTFPETALALLALAAQARPAGPRIQQKRFTDTLCREYGIRPIFLRERIAEGIRAGYIEVPSKGYIWPSALVESEEAYLTVLSKEFKMRSSRKSTSTTRRRH
jgi:hypothetical protein